MNIGGVQDVKVDLSNRMATVSHNGVGLEAMKAAVDDAGYEVVGAE
jgi:copper chaperone CopZ